MEGFLDGLETLPIPTLAVVEGFAVGGGLAIAAVCDFRIATPGSRFGVPIARTLGNCMSMQNYARLVAALGAGAREAHAAARRHGHGRGGAGARLRARRGGAGSARRARRARSRERLVKNAPITMRVSKEAIRRS